jgi:hypothetical protein
MGVVALYFASATFNALVSVAFAIKRQWGLFFLAAMLSAFWVFMAVSS